MLDGLQSISFKFELGHIPNMDPMLIETSILLDPSTGSIFTMYRLGSFEIISGFSSSSQPTIETLSDVRKHSRKIWEPNSSSFWTTSPCILMSPVDPECPSMLNRSTFSWTRTAPFAIAANVDLRWLSISIDSKYSPRNIMVNSSF